MTNISLITGAAIGVTVQSRVIGIIIALTFFVVLLELVRRHKLQERYTIIWMITGALLLVTAAIPQVLNLLRSLLGVADSTAALFIVLFIILGVIILNLTIVIAKQSEQINRLGQEIGIINSELEEQKKTKNI